MSVAKSGPYYVMVRSARQPRLTPTNLCGHRSWLMPYDGPCLARAPTRPSCASSSGPRRPVSVAAVLHLLCPGAAHSPPLRPRGARALDNRSAADAGTSALAGDSRTPARHHIRPAPCGPFPRETAPLPARSSFRARSAASGLSQQPHRSQSSTASSAARCHAQLPRQRRCPTPAKCPAPAASILHGAASSTTTAGQRRSAAGSALPPQPRASSA
jgi:hypothetical protein